MQAYRVIGRGFHVGAGALLLLSTAQATGRAHKLEPLPGGGRVCDGFGLARAKETQAFKAGELLGLTEPPKGQLELVEDVVPVKGKRDRDDPVLAFLEALKIHNAMADRAEEERARKIEQEEAARLAEQEQRETAARESAWAEEWATTEAVKKDYPKVGDYVAARRKEFAEASKAQPDKA
ncbi:hypothetical protein I3J27_21455 [Bradyrhizobium xenonodulans]|uniref:Uncharacterized protein n=1 Tax=Bradyrhizobium xenonodulans TaxID=2736875 RepID=A0ABY7MG14_9BRAD|nr:hypothetical protein [Bradyrhizobium xenonodulans]WBL75602.1 hypothetical protein I3J27_21455 [Bradyrhizobium xenonodulans]